jgi:transglycosylase-like protein with SLT domain
LPTLIDALIVELSLDSSKFTAGQQRATEQLRRFEQAATKSSANVEKSGVGLIAFFRALENPIGALRHHFEQLITSSGRVSQHIGQTQQRIVQQQGPLTNYFASIGSAIASLNKTIAAGVSGPHTNLAALAAQGRRTGSSLQSGALAGAAGYRVLGLAVGGVGLAAVVATAAIDKMMTAAQKNAQGIFGTGTRAGAAGLPIGAVSTIAQAMFAGGNVPQEQTEAWLAEFGQWQSKLGTIAGDSSRIGLLSAALGPAGRGVRWSGPGAITGEQLLLKLAEVLPGQTEQRAITSGGFAGLSPEASLELRRLGRSGLEHEMEVARQRRITEEQYHASLTYLKSLNNLSNAMTNLGHSIMLIVNGPLDQVNKALTGFADFLTRLFGGNAPGGGSSPGGLGERQTAPGGGTRWWEYPLMPFGYSIGKRNWQKYISPHLPPWLGGGLSTDPGTNPNPAPLGRGNRSSPDPGMNPNPAPLSHGRGIGPSSAITPVPGGTMQDTARRAAAAYGVPEAMFMHLIPGESSWNPNEENFEGAGHVGLGQFDPETARQYGITNRRDPTQSLYGAAHNLSDLQRHTGSWQGAIRRYLGATSEASFQRAMNPEYREAWRQAGIADRIAPQAPLVSSQSSSIAQADITPSNGDRRIQTNVRPPSTVPDYFANESGTVLRPGEPDQAEGVDAASMAHTAVSTVRHHHYHRERHTANDNRSLSVGDVHVHVPSGSDGYAIGGAVIREITRLKDSINANTANTGLW